MLAGLVTSLGVGTSPAVAVSGASGSTWLPLAHSTHPTARVAASMAYDPATREVVLFGGYNGEAATADTWAWNGKTWAEPSPSTSPPARSDASMAYDATTGQLILFGGYTGSGYLSDTWSWNGTTWTELFPSTSPPAREDAALVYDPATAQLVLFGGYGGGMVGFNDTWTWDGTTWTEVSPPTSPPARDDAAMAYDSASRQLVLFGGYDGNWNLADTWTWNGTTWTELSPRRSPSDRAAPFLAYDPDTGRLVLFGGYNGSRGAVYFDDTWTWNGTSWTELSPAKSPPARSAGCIADDAASDQLVIFGGYGKSDFLGDTWSFVTAPSAPTSLTAVPGKADVTLSWSVPVSDGGRALTGYDVYEGTKSGEESAEPVNARPLSPAANGYTRTGLKKGTRYYFVVKAINPAGAGTASNQASAVPS